MRLFQRNGIWYIQLSRTVKKSLHTKDKIEAKYIAKQIEKEYFKGSNIVPLASKVNKTIGEFFNEYLVWSEQNQSNFTYKRTSAILKKFASFVSPSTDIAELKPRQLESYISFLRSKKLSSTSINIEIRHIKSALSKAVQWEYLKSNPFRTVKQIKTTKGRPYFLTIEEIEKVFAVIGDNYRYRLIFALYIYTGMRRSELSRLNWQDIDMQKGIIHVRQSKNYEQREIPISDRLREILSVKKQNIGRVVDVTLDQIGRGMKFYLRQAGLPHIRPHDLRHTFASHLIMAGVDIRTVAELLGHKSLSVTQIYTHLLSEHKQKAISKLPY